MDADLVLIFAFVLTIVLIVTVGVATLVNRSLEHKERMAASKKPTGSVAGEDYRKLEERVRVLERIATDGGQDIALQIEQLRDLQELDRVPEQQERAQ